MAASSELSPEEMAAHREAARRRDEAERRTVAAREVRAWELARRAAALRLRFVVRRVVVFGSLVHPGCVTAWSDVDIAAWGLRPEETFRAIGVAMDVDAEITVNLVDVAACKSSLLVVIERDGVDL